jgi:hypothetical protein
MHGGHSKGGCPDSSFSLGALTTQHHKMRACQPKPWWRGGTPPQGPYCKIPTLANTQKLLPPGVPPTKREWPPPRQPPARSQALTTGALAEGLQVEAENIGV